MQIVCESFDKVTCFGAFPEFSFTIGEEENETIVSLTNFKFVVKPQVSEGQKSPVCFDTSTKQKIGCFKSKPECLKDSNCQKKAWVNINNKKKQSDSDIRRNIVLDGM